MISSWAADRKADSVGNAELVSMVEGYSRSSSRPSAKRSSTLTEACGWRIKRTSCIQILTLMPLSVSFISHFVLSDTYQRTEIEHSLNWYRFIGRILGKAMYEGILVDVAFAGFFLAKVCIILHVYSADSFHTLSAVAGQAEELLGRSCVARSRPLPRTYLLEALHWKSGRSISQFYCRG